MASYASSGPSSGSSSTRLAALSSSGTGFGILALQRARAAGMTDTQIRNELSRSDIPIGGQAASQLGLRARTSTPQRPVGSYASPSGYRTTAGAQLNSGVQGITGLMNRAPGNAALQSLGQGKLFDIFATQANMGLALNYNESMIGSMAEVQYGLENLRAGNALKLTAAEGAIQKDIAQLQSDTSLGLGRLSLEGTKYTADQSLRASNYSADRTLEGAKYVSDRNLEGTKYVADESTRRVRVQGDEDRKTLGENTLQTIRLREDARRAMRNAGSRFYS